ncbi:hypothetical protein [Bernardetia sp.]|uniref:hypothetical protein n=1 Tax=Bernardetia sp. TaxID=1937974 RepID=UPI0025C1DDF3|nr:hypothetical protein [Bernardetia sp.]
MLYHCWRFFHNSWCFSEVPPTTNKLLKSTSLPLSNALFSLVAVIAKLKHQTNHDVKNLER